MIRLELTTKEADILAKTLTSYISDLRMEVAGTEAMDFREVLKEEEAVLKKILAMLQQS